MMDKLASNAYSQGAYDALESMDIPQHIKVAAAQYMTKEADGRLQALKLLGTNAAKRVGQAFKSRGGALKDVVAARGGDAGLVDKALRNARLQDAAIVGGLGLTGIGAVGAGANAMGAFDDEPQLEQDLLSRIQRGELNKELALGAAGLGAAGLGAYALS